MGQCNVSYFEVDASAEIASEERRGTHTWIKYPGDVYVLKGGITKADLAGMRSEIDALRHHPTRHVRGPFESYDDAPNSAKMMCTFNYYSPARPMEPVPRVCMSVANAFLEDFGLVGDGCLVIHYPQGSQTTKLPWHTDMSGHGGPVLTMSWGESATFLWSPSGKNPTDTTQWDITKGGVKSIGAVYRLEVEEGDAVFFDGGKLPHAVTNVKGERYNVQVRKYAAVGELELDKLRAIEVGDACSSTRLASWRAHYEKVPSRYPCGSKFDTWYQLDCSMDHAKCRVRAMYTDLLKKAIRNEAVREPERVSDADDHHVDMAEDHLAALRKKFGDQLGDTLAVYDRYLELLRKVRCGGLYGGVAQGEGSGGLNLETWALAEAHLPKLKARFGDDVKLEVLDVYGWFLANTPVAHSLGERSQLDNTQACVEQALADSVPGDLIETGVWQGGQTILMRGVLAAHGVLDRVVYVADSFQGLPDTDEASAPDDAVALCLLEGIGKFQVTADVVRSNFAKYDLLDDRVLLLEGWFKETLPKASFGCFAVIRLDGDFYESTCDALEQLYPRLSPGGFAIIDDYGVESFGCKRAVDEYRAAHGIDTPLLWVSGQTVYWRKQSTEANIQGA